MIRRPFPRQGSLYVTPKPFAREAMSSWLLRTAASHGCSWPQMRALLGLGMGVDPDFVWPWELASSAAFLAVPVDALVNLLTWCQSYVPHAEAYDLVLGSAIAPEFSVCARCVRERNAMHYCVESRLDFVTLCPEHGVLMERQEHHDVYSGVISGDRMKSAMDDHLDDAPEVRARRVNRFNLERRVRIAMKSGYERHPTMGMIPVQSLLAAERWRLRPKAAIDEGWREQRQDDRYTVSRHRLIRARRGIQKVPS